MQAAQALQVLYSISGLIIVLFYLPQFLTVVGAKSDLRDISLSTWGVWAVCVFNSFLYGHFVLDDKTLAIFSLASSSCCFSIFVITFFKRKKYAQNKLSTNLIFRLKQ